MFKKFICNHCDYDNPCITFAENGTVPKYCPYTGKLIDGWYHNSREQTIQTLKDLYVTCTGDENIYTKDK